MTIDLASQAVSEDGDAVGARAEGAETEPYCLACGSWAGMFMPGEGWRHSRGNPAPNGTQAPFDAGHDVELAWCVPPARSISPAQHEHAAASGYATAYRVLRRQLARSYKVPISS